MRVRAVRAVLRWIEEEGGVGDVGLCYRCTE